jgi:hypothetical protein
MCFFAHAVLTRQVIFKVLQKTIMPFPVLFELVKDNERITQDSLAQVRGSRPDYLFMFCVGIQLLLFRYSSCFLRLPWVD